MTGTPAAAESALKFRDTPSGISAAPSLRVKTRPSVLAQTAVLPVREGYRRAGITDGRIALALVLDAADLVARPQF
jgi:hypothetical protein